MQLKKKLELKKFKKILRILQEIFINVKESFQDYPKNNIISMNLITFCKLV